ncbi:anti-sigma factor [Nocardioides currus]|uniref:Regulator of SigK n=1 Tax=Nocardioides currus TaxID=2133958 RepID=A0A2R7YYA0_9ACTN|nr:anti-sigma factor [Nocardioides currus]PUA81352.1 anti-sigma factor [Nocardioides currus]
MSDIHKLSGAYALDAVDDIERAAFERHLAECEDCRLEVASLRETTALLSESVAIAPPASLRDSVLTGISQIRPLPPVVVPARRAAWFPLLVAAAVLAVVGVGLAAWQPWSSTVDKTDQGSLTAAEQVLRAPDAQSVSVDLGDAGQATVTRSKALHKAVIKTVDMSDAPSGQVYQLWLQQHGELVSAGLMEGGGNQEIVLEGDAATASAAGVTVEPAGGSQTPNLPPVALFDFSQAT